MFVWHGDLQADPATVARYARLLAQDEAARAARFRFERHQRRFTVSRALLRLTLSELTGKAADSISFEYGEQGKPSVAGGPAFNLSHSGDRLLIAVTDSGRLGVDVEEVAPVRSMERLAESKFAEDEAAQLLRTHEDERRTVFFRIWTKKEAFIKALGGGLSIPLRSFSVDPTPEALQALLRVDDPVESLSQWVVRGLPCPTGAEAAFAIDRPRTAIEPLPFEPGL